MIHKSLPSRNSEGVESHLDLLPAYRMSCGFSFAIFCDHPVRFRLFLVGYQTKGTLEHGQGGKK